MASEADNDIVIECSPYGDSETEIVNLKNPSYEIISMPDLFEYEKSLSIFIYVVSALGLLGFFYLISKIILSNKLSRPKLPGVKLPGVKVGNLSSVSNMLSSMDQDDLNAYIYYFLLFLLFFVGIFTSIPQEDVNLIPIYILFGIVILILSYVQYSSQGNTYKFENNGLLILRTLFPSPNNAHEISMLNIIGQFVVLWILLYVLISLFRMIDNTEDAFSAIGLLSSYCFLKILDYMITSYKYKPENNAEYDVFNNEENNSFNNEGNNVGNIEENNNGIMDENEYNFNNNEHNNEEHVIV